jgi:hypothetical protein
VGEGEHENPTVWREAKAVPVFGSPSPTAWERGLGGEGRTAGVRVRSGTGNYALRRQAMERVNVESSMIEAVGYDPDSKEMEVVFHSGQIYRYADVPREVYEGLLAADSKGQYMHAHVLDAFPYRQVRRGRD